MNDRIKKVRKALDLTQQEFAKRIGIKRNTIATYETGKSKPSDAAVSLFCREFNINETWLRTGEGDMFIPLSKDEEITAFVNRICSTEADTFQKRYLLMLSRLGESDWVALEHMVENIKKD